MRALVDPRYAHLNVTEVALGCGFDNVTVFSRAFKKHFGMTPSVAKRERPPPIEVPSSDGSDRLWETWFRAL